MIELQRSETPGRGKSQEAQAGNVLKKCVGRGLFEAKWTPERIRKGGGSYSHWAPLAHKGTFAQI